MIQTLINLLNEDIQARTKADSSTTAENIGVSQHDAKPDVVGSVCGSQEHDRLVAWYGRCIHCKGTKMKQQTLPTTNKAWRWFGIWKSSARKND